MASAQPYYNGTNKLSFISADYLDKLNLDFLHLWKIAQLWNTLSQKMNF